MKMDSLDSSPSWTPTEARLETSRIEEFRQWVNNNRGLDLRDYHGLWQWSVDELDDFWRSVWTYFDVISSERPRDVLGSRKMPGAEWFPGAHVNYSEHVFRDRDPAAIAIQHASELRELGHWTWGELEQHTARIAGGLRELGVGPGDVVAAYLPNLPETVAALLACASIGAIWSSAAPEFGTQAVIDRFTQIEPTVLLSIDGYRYGGKDFDRSEVIAALQASLPTVKHTVVLPYLDSTSLSGTMSWNELLAAGEGRALDFERVPFDHPLWVLYSSGTTGLPKAIVHSQGGILIEHLKALNLHLDAHTGDRIFWFTTTGWMMWNYLVGCLLTPASIILFDGNPAYPDMDTLWKLAEDTEMTCFGTSASFISSSMKAGLEPAKKFDLRHLNAVGSTGSPLSMEGFDWVWNSVGPDIWLFSTSGGTDTCTAFLAGVPTLPVYRGELQAAALGAKVESWDELGKPHVGRVGELVITEPMPSMPICLWGDGDGSKLHSSYFDTYPGIWRHGDWIEFTEHGSAVIRGRSDATINRGGIRMGTAEIYRAVLSIDEVVDALVVDIPRTGDNDFMPLFVVLAEDVDLGDELRARIRATIRTTCSPRHVPSEIIAVEDVPRTLSGKILEVPVKRILMGEPVSSSVSKGSLQNPTALDFFSDFFKSMKD